MAQCVLGLHNCDEDCSSSFSSLSPSSLSIFAEEHDTFHEDVFVERVSLDGFPQYYSTIALVPSLRIHTSKAFSEEFLLLSLLLSFPSPFSFFSSSLLFFLY